MDFCVSMENWIILEFKKLEYVRDGRSKTSSMNRILDPVALVVISGLEPVTMITESLI